MTNNPVVVYGFGGFGREVAWLAQQTGHRVVAFLDDNASLHEHTWQGIRVWRHPDDVFTSYPNAHIVVSPGNPKIREKITERLANQGYPFTTLIHPNTEYSATVQIGSGSVICANNILTVDITIGSHVHINLDCTVGHDVVMEDYATLAPGVHVSGWVHICKRVYIGTGATIINGTSDQPLVIGNDAVIGAGACVVRNIEAGVTAVGVPAKPLNKSM